MYGFILAYHEQLTQHHYPIKASAQQGNLAVESTKLQTTTTMDHSSKDRIQNQCKKLLSQAPKTIVWKRNHGLRFLLKTIRYFGEEMYMVFELKNTSAIDFEVAYLDASMVTGSNKRRAAQQQKQFKSIYRFQVHKQVAMGEKQQFVMVFPKFVPGPNEQFQIHLKELHGNRDLMLRYRL